MPEAPRAAADSENQNSIEVGGKFELRVTRDPSAKRGVYRVQSRSTGGKVNTTVRVISPGMAKVATAR